MTDTRQFHIRAALGTARREMFHGREHLIVPVVALMEGVIHAVNASHPEFVPVATLSAAPHQWNGRPLVFGHPTKGGQQISANDARVLEDQSFGTIFNARMAGTKLLMDAYVDPVRAGKVGGDAFVQRILNGEVCEVSVGAFVTTDSTAGMHNGKQYKARWSSIAPDHLAFLPGSRGACSIDMGCGSHRAAGEAPVMHEIVNDELVVAAGFDSSQQRDGDGQWTSKGGSPLRERGGHMGIVHDEVDPDRGGGNKHRQHDGHEGSITPKEGDHVIVAAPKMHTTGKRGRVVSSSRDGSFHTVHDHRGKTIGIHHSSDLKVVERRYASSHQQDCDQCEGAGQINGVSCSFCDGMGQIKTAAAVTKEQNMKEALIKSLTACPCSGFNEDDEPMLEALSFNRLSELKAFSDERKQTIETLKTAGEKMPTVEEFLATQPDLKALVDGARAAEEAKKTGLVDTLKAAQTVYSEDELKALNIETLDKLVQLTAVAPPIDYSGKGVPVTPRHAAAAEDFTPPNPYAPKAH